MNFRLSLGREFAIIGIVDSVNAHERLVTISPVILGFPLLGSLTERRPVLPPWNWHSFYEHTIDEVEEFERAKSVSTVALDWSKMQSVSEKSVKSCFAKLLGDAEMKDWGGEKCDHFSSNVTLAGRRLSAAFLFKGPADWVPMKINHFGKNADQMLRIMELPADLFVVQHSHEITIEMRYFLRKIAQSPGVERRYMFVDGRDTFRLLTAYGLLDSALAATELEKASRANSRQKSGAKAKRSKARLASESPG